MMLERTTENLFVEVSQIVTIPKKYLSNQEWRQLNEMDKEDIIELMGLESIDLDSEILENVISGLNED